MTEARQSPRLRRWVLGGGVALLVVVAGAALRRPARVRVSVERVTKTDLVAPVLCDGNLEPPPGGELRAPESSTVAVILAREGEHVAKGTALVRLDDADLKQAAWKARGAALELEDEEARASADLARARRDAAHAREVFEADARLLKDSAISRATYEADRLGDRQARDTLAAAQARLDSIGGASGRPARRALARELARDLEARVAALTLTAPRDGVAYGLPTKAGETVSAGQIVASVADPDHMRVRVRVDQPDLPRILVGQPFLVTFDGLPDRRWEGKVLSVSTGVKESGGREVGEVVGEISDPKLQLPPNASVNVQIVVGQRHGVLTIARAAILRDGGKRFVYLLEGGRARRRDVATGLIGTNDVEITSGLQDRDVVILPGSAPVADGTRVAVAKPSP